MDLPYLGLTLFLDGSFTPFAILAIDIMVRLKPFADAPPVKAEVIEGMLHATKIKMVVETKNRGINPATCATDDISPTTALSK